MKLCYKCCDIFAIFVKQLTKCNKYIVYFNFCNVMLYKLV